MNRCVHRLSAARDRRVTEDFCGMDITVLPPTAPVTVAPVSSLPVPAQAPRPAGDPELAAVSEGAAAPVLGRQGPARNRADACLKPVEADLLLIFGCQAKEEVKDENYARRRRMSPTQSRFPLALA